jgi:hypothetical protein
MGVVCIIDLANAVERADLTVGFFVPAIQAM